MRRHRWRARPAPVAAPAPPSAPPRAAGQTRDLAGRHGKARSPVKPTTSALHRRLARHQHGHSEPTGTRIPTTVEHQAETRTSVPDQRHIQAGSAWWQFSRNPPSAGSSAVRALGHRASTFRHEVWRARQPLTDRQPTADRAPPPARPARATRASTVPGRWPGRRRARCPDRPPPGIGGC